MTLITPEHLIRSLRRTPVLLDAVLCGVTQERACVATDGPDGWSVLHVVCHLRDFEAIFFQRARRMVEEERPTLAAYDQEALAVERDYGGQDLNEAYGLFLEARRRFVAWLEERAPEDWGRVGLHPEHGEYTLLEQVLYVPLHDLDHLQQMARALGLPCDDTAGQFGLALA